MPSQAEIWQAYAHWRPRAGMELPPFAPDGSSWTDYVVRSYDQPGTIPDVALAGMSSDSQLSGQSLLNEIGWGELGQVIDPNNARAQEIVSQIQGMNTRRSGENPDLIGSIFGDQLLPALGLFGLGVGSAALLGLGAEAAAGGGAAAVGEGVSEASAAGVAGEGALFGGGGTAAGGGGAAAATGGTEAAIAAGSGLETAAAGAGAGTAATTTATTGLTTAGTLAQYAPLAAAGLGAIGSVVGGITAGNAAKDAADTQSAAADKSNDTLLAMYNQARDDLEAYRTAGYKALGQLGEMSDNAAQYGTDQYPSSMDTSAYKTDTSQYAFDSSKYDFGAPSGQQVLDDDPGYQFRLAQGQKALEASAAARGGLLSGGTGRALQDYGQKAASQEYDAAYNRKLGQNQLAYERGLTGNELAYQRDTSQKQQNYSMDYQKNQDTYNRNLQLRQQRVNELAGLAGIGQNAVNSTTQAGQNTSSQVANNITGSGNAQAAGTIGQSNATQSIFSGIGNAANSYLQYSALQQQLEQSQKQNDRLYNLYSSQQRR